MHHISQVPREKSCQPAKTSSGMKEKSRHPPPKRRSENLSPADLPLMNVRGSSWVRGARRQGKAWNLHGERTAARGEAASRVSMAGCPCVSVSHPQGWEPGAPRDGAQHTRGSLKPTWFDSGHGSLSTPGSHVTCVISTLPATVRNAYSAVYPKRCRMRF